jgi:hypothetical protein
MWIQKLFSTDPSVSLMRIVVATIVINALLMLNYIVFIRQTPLTSQEANLIIWMIGTAVSGKAGQSIGENRILPTGNVTK